MYENVSRTRFNLYETMTCDEIGVLIIIYLVGFFIAGSYAHEFDVPNSFSKVFLWPIWFLVELIKSIICWINEN